MLFQRLLQLVIWIGFTGLLIALPAMVAPAQPLPTAYAQQVTFTPVPSATPFPAPNSTASPLQIRTYTDPQRLWQLRYAPQLFARPQQTQSGLTVFRALDGQAFFAVDTADPRLSPSDPARELRARALAVARELSGAQVNPIQDLVLSDRWQVGITFAGRNQGGEAVYEQYGLRYGDTRFYGVIIGYRTGTPQELITTLLAMRDTFQGRTFTAAFGMFAGGGFSLIDPNTARANPARNVPTDIPLFEMAFGDLDERRSFTILARAGPAAARNNGEVLTAAAFFRQFPRYVDVLPNLSVNTNGTQVFFSACNIAATDSPERRCDGFGLNVADRTVRRLEIGGWQSGLIAPTGDRAVGMVFVGAPGRPDGMYLYRVRAETQRISSATLRTVAWLPEGRFVFSTADDPANRVPQRLIISSADGRDRRFLVRDTPANELAATPDGRWLAYIREDTGEVWVINLANQRRTRIANAPAGGQGLTWLPGS